jgi:hypothetical protein
MQNFSYEAYIQLINQIKRQIPLVDFAKIKPTDNQFFILRHDVEFSVEKAYELALIEQDSLGIRSSYFFQIRNYAYNPLAFKNSVLIEKMHAMGHKIGLHVNMSGLTPKADINAFIRNEVSLLEKGLGFPVDRFSFHRPTHALLAANIQIPGLINAYDPLFFHYYDKEPPRVLKVHYFSDSEHQWKYGDPLTVLNARVQKIQLLTHPYSWSEVGFENVENFKAIIKLKEVAALQAMREECRNFPDELFKP